ncbi:hypothetical protein MYOV003v1_p0007 [Vibrio phage 207E48.1]|nr:hypothetical protein MYOV003v1_p0007 [Vibrio phage 207E48.1]
MKVEFKTTLTPAEAVPYMRDTLAWHQVVGGGNTKAFIRAVVDGFCIVGGMHLDVINTTIVDEDEMLGMMAREAVRISPFACELTADAGSFTSMSADDDKVSNLIHNRIFISNGDTFIKCDHVFGKTYEKLCHQGTAIPCIRLDDMSINCVFTNRMAQVINPVEVAINPRLRKA